MRPLGPVVEATKVIVPGYAEVVGKHVRLARLTANYTDDLWEAGLSSPENDWIFDYLFQYPFKQKADLHTFLASVESSKDPLFHAIIDLKTSKCVGWFSLMRMDPPNRVLELGNVMLAPPLQKTTAATEAFYLFLKYIFDTLNYRRSEWKLNNLNELSHRSARRLGHTYEGTFRKHMINKGHTRDTAWYSIVDDEWPVVKAGFESWLDPSNFDSNGKQLRSLEACREAAKSAS